MQLCLPFELKDGDRVLWVSPLGDVPGIYRGWDTQIGAFYKLQELNSENCWAANPYQVTKL